MEIDELENVPESKKTKRGGYLKDGFVVSDNEDEDQCDDENDNDDSEDEDEDEDDESEHSSEYDGSELTEDSYITA